MVRALVASGVEPLVIAGLSDGNVIELLVITGAFVTSGENEENTLVISKVGLVVEGS